LAAIVEALPDNTEVFRGSPHSRCCVGNLAASALARLGERAVSPLQVGLTSDDPKLRLRSLGALADIGPDAKSVVHDVVKALDDPDKWVRLRAAKALQRIDPQND